MTSDQGRWNSAPSRKMVSAVITMSYVLAAMITATLIHTPDALAGDALWVIGLVGGVTVGGQALVDRMASGRKK